MKKKLYVGGAHLCGSGYPNAKQTIDILQQELGLEVVQCGAWLPDTYHLWKIAAGSKVNAVVKLSRILFINLCSFFKIIALLARQMRRDGQKVVVYIPYPALFLLLMFSVIPKRYRPYIIVDAYISIWDAMFRDRSRQKLHNESFLSRWLKAVEKRALQVGDKVLVDTDANKIEYARLFDLSLSKVLSLPLAIDDKLFISLRPSVRRGEKVSVLFVGTFIPLHGIAVILDAIELLGEDKRLEFLFIGDGQQSFLLEEFISRVKPNNLVWQRGWTPLENIAAAIERADICLGVFGGEAKAARVLPFKLYMYLAAGRAIVSQEKMATPENVPLPPILGVPVDSPVALANAIVELANSEEKREQLGRHAKQYYAEFLGRDAIGQRWQRLLEDVAEQ